MVDYTDDGSESPEDLQTEEAAEEDENKEGTEGDVDVERVGEGLDAEDVGEGVGDHQPIEEVFEAVEVSGIRITLRGAADSRRRTAEFPKERARK